MFELARKEMQLKFILIFVVVLAVVVMDLQEESDFPEVTQSVNVVNMDSDCEEILNVSALDRTIHPEDFGSDFW